MDYKDIMDAFLTIVENPSFKDSDLKVANNFKIEPLMALSQSINNLDQEFEKLRLKKNLEKKLETKIQNSKITKI